MTAAAANGNPNAPDAAEWADDDTPIPTPGTAKPYLPKRFSPSSAGLFRDCARRWRYRYVDKLPETPSVDLSVGSFVHEVLEHLMAAPPTERTLKQARTVAGNLWPAFSRLGRFKQLGLNPDETNAFKWRAWHHVEGFFSQTDPAEINVVGREEQLETEVGGVPFVGVVDLVESTDDGLRITDYKTGKAPNPRFTDDKLTQVWLYAAAFEAQTSRQISHVRLQYLPNAADRHRWPGAVVERPMDVGAVAAAEQQHADTFSALTHAVTTNQFEPTPGPLCSYCDFRAYCPEGEARHRENEARKGHLPS